MFNFIKKKMNKKGFTLVELLVVIAVLGIIAGIAIPRMSGITDSFKTKADQQTATNLARLTEVRIQIGAITTSGSAVNVTLDKAGLGEVFTDKPQSLPNGFFVIEATDSEIKVYTGANATAKTTLLITRSHGGKIE